VHALDRKKLVHVDIGHLFEVGEAFRDQELGEELVEIERIHEELRPLGELGLTAPAFFLFREDVDVEPGQLRGEADVLAAPADGERKLLVRDHDLDLAGLLVDYDLGNLGGLQRVHKERRLVLVPRNDVDLLALKLIHHGLHTRAPHADAGADGVYGAVVGDHADLGARPRIAGDGLDLDDAVVDLRHFHLEQFRHELRIGPGKEDLRPARFAADILDVAADPVVRAVAFAADLLVSPQDRLAPADVDDDVAVFLALDHAVDDRALAVLEFLELAVALGLAHLLQDHLLGGLRGDAAKVHRRHLVHDFVTDLG